MATIKAIYKGDLRTDATHLQSGTALTMDAPTDNHGKGESFSPTDLVATALGGCIATIIGISSQTHGFDIGGAQMEITKVMASDPRRIAEIRIEFFFPRDYDQKTKRIIELCAKQCPVGQSLHPDLLQNVIYHYGKA
jgi:Predicted redox protein, regulator of disulfide bond formation